MKTVYVKTVYIAMGCSWQGNLTRRDGKLVTCGHRHKTSANAERCHNRMRKEKPSKCQSYRVFKINLRPT